MSEHTKRKKRIAMYYMHYSCLGHTSMIGRLAKILSEDSEMLVIQAGERQDFVHRDFNIVNIPLSMTKRNIWWGAEASISPHIIRQRLAFVKKELDVFKPDIFITEFFPFGMKLFSMEIIPLIMYLKSLNPHLKVYASVFSPYMDNEKVLAYAKHYDKILIHCPLGLDREYLAQVMRGKGDADTLSFYQDVFNTLRDKIHYTNYITDKRLPLPEEKIRKQFHVGARQKLVLVSRGGGVTNPQIITAALRAAEIAGKEFFFIIVYGPSSSAQEESIFRTMANGKQNVALLRFYEHLPDLLNACDVSVSMAGYNTALETMWLGKKSVIIPRSIRAGSSEEGPARLEQHYRAVLLHEKIGSTILYYHELTPLRLADAIREQAGRNSAPPLHAQWFDSEAIIAREFLE